MGKSNAANWAARWARPVPDRANDPKRKVTGYEAPMSVGEGKYSCPNCGGAFMAKKATNEGGANLWNYTCPECEHTVRQVR